MCLERSAQEPEACMKEFESRRISVRSVAEIECGGTDSTS